MILLSDDPRVMQNMIDKLREYCDMWNLEINMQKSKMMVFRNGGKLAAAEKWFIGQDEIEIVSEYSYLGVIMTPQISFSKHVESRCLKAKAAINAAWKNVLANKNVSIQGKWKIFLAVCRAIQSYAAQVWGFGFFDDIDKLQRFFLRRILGLPEFTPNYALAMETGVDDSHLYTLDLHLRYITKTLFTYQSDRLPHKLSKELLAKNIFWVRSVRSLMQVSQEQWEAVTTSQSEWSSRCKELMVRLRSEAFERRQQEARQSDLRIYKHLNYNLTRNYFGTYSNINDSVWIFKARCDMLGLNHNCFNPRQSRLCSLCNLAEPETMFHFLGICPILSETRRNVFNKTTLSNREVIEILNDADNSNWNGLVQYVKIAWRYRRNLVLEFN